MAELLKPTAGDHVYVVPPVAWRVVLVPGQIDILLPAFTLILGLTVTVTDDVPEHPEIFVAVTV